MKIKLMLNIVMMLLLFSGCKESKQDDAVKANYNNYSKRDDQSTGGIKMIPINTPIGKFNVWT